MNYNRIAKKINRLSKKMAAMSDSELQNQTEVIREMITNKASELKVLVRAFSVVREADKRILGLYPNDEQVIGAITIYYGNIAEMKTGEGKTLVGTMPLYLRALQMKGVFLVTTNEYLAHRDYEKNAAVYKWLGLTVADGTAGIDLPLEVKKEIYTSDIIYTSNGILGFDYLLDGLADNEEKRYISDLNYAILDEVDAILLDAAQTPLLISGAPKVQSNYFESSNNFVITLDEDIDYKFDEERKNVWLTASGINNAKDYFSIPDLLSVEYFTLYQHIILALKAQFIFTRNKEYIVDDGEIKLLDLKNGRVMEGTSLQSGLQQAIEAKEGIKLSDESQTISSITYQNLFRKFSMLSGMTGTAKTNEDEFIETYNMSVKRIHTHKKNRRKDHKHQQYVTFNEKFYASMKKILELHETGRPVLIITGSVEASELYSLYLFNLGIAHSVLNAKNHMKEALIVKEAGNHGALTVATAMAGRGTDITIDEASTKLGGLAVVLTETMPSLRIELQAKGRSGRQGLPGDTYSYESLEDDIIKENIQESIQKYYQKHQNSTKKIRKRRIKKAFVRAQQKSEDNSRNSRLNNLQFDEIMRLQKSMIDNGRDNILAINDYESIHTFIMKNARKVIHQNFMKQENITEQDVTRYILDNIDYNFKTSNHQLFENNRQALLVDDVIEFCLTIFENNLEKKQTNLNDEEAFIQYLKITVLKAIDVSWSDQVDSLNQLRFVVQSRLTAQRNPILEFEREAKNQYEHYRTVAEEMILRNAALSMFNIVKGELIVTFP